MESIKNQLNKPGVRVRFVLCDFDEEIWKIMPCRINAGDGFYIDEFLTEEDEKRISKETIDELYNEFSILDCERVIFGNDEDGIFQQVYLVSRD